jgi:hypothetical protein
MSTIKSVKNILYTDIPTTFSNFPLFENNTDLTDINENNDENKREKIIENIREILSLFSAIAKYHKNIIWDIRTILTNNNQKYISLIQNKNNTITIYDFHIENTNIMNIQNHQFVRYIFQCLQHLQFVRNTKKDLVDQVNNRNKDQFQRLYW